MFSIKNKRVVIYLIEVVQLIFLVINLGETRNTDSSSATRESQQPFKLVLLSESDTGGDEDPRNSDRDNFQRRIHNHDHDERPSQYYSAFKLLLPERLLADVDYFDKLSVDSQLGNKEFVESQLRCLIYDGTCDFFGRKAKELLPSIILDNCRLCTQTQKNKLSRVVVHLQQHYPGEWRDALIKYGSAPKFITAGQVVPGATFFGVVQHHHGNKKHRQPPQHFDNNYNRGVIHFRNNSPNPTAYELEHLNPVIPSPQLATISNESGDSNYATTKTITPSNGDEEEQPPTTMTTQQSPQFSLPNNYNHRHLPMTMTSTLVAPIPVIASISATSTSPIPEQLGGVVEAPPIYPTTTLMMNSYTNNMDSTTITTVPSFYDLSSSSSSMEPPSTSVVESTIEIKPTTTEPFHHQHR